MPSSSKVFFDLKTLKTKALESIDARIAAKELEVASYDDDAALQQRVDTWRERQEERLDELLTGILKGEIDNHRLSRWEIEDIPKVDRYDRQRAERELRSLEATKTQIIAKSESLVPDKDGNVSLTSTQLSEFFGL